MLWLIGQISVFLLIAAVIGFLVGWLVRTLWPSSRTRVREGELQAALGRAGSRISDLEAGLRSKRVAAVAAAEQEEAALRRVEELEAALATLHSQSDADTGEVDLLQDELDTALSSINSLRHEMAEIHASVDEMAALEAERAATPGQFPPAGQPEGDPALGGLFLVQNEAESPAPSTEPGEGDTDDQDGEAQRLEAVARVTERFRLLQDVEPDDLKQIRGVGPVLERLLLSMNISTFRQIADFDDEDIDLVSAALGNAFPDRIRRDDWMASARDLLREPPGGDS